MYLNISKIDTDYGGDVNRIGENTCSKADIRIFQAPTGTLPNGIPSFTVEILNACPSSGCSVSEVHVKCGWFSSVRLINPRVFKRLSFDDCLVKNGDPLTPGEALSFQYANTFRYPLSVSSIAGCST
ncbi:hypothetical protein L484_010591 [Morus notabilis]|uniref:Uncharacterized protein n=1 Tax=Morus notabilis TaxID=981085 RepID=W9QNJ8_9ROSA|nr:hypothetical protein L484_010591 [Morus notabilis]